MQDALTGSLKGQFLLAMPGLTDPNFSQTVTCICEHTEGGAVGVVINRLFESLSAKDIFQELGIGFQAQTGQLPVHLGGPVHVDEVFVLHGPPFGWKGCLLISPSLALSNTRDVLEAIAQGSGPESFILTLGCAGWGPGQLEHEIGENAWLTCAAFEEIVFDEPVATRWESAVRKMGIDPSLLSQTAGHA
jgi:putative transcriptional regulator